MIGVNVALADQNGTDWPAWFDQNPGCRRVLFRLARPTILLNELLRLHHREQTRRKRALCAAVRVATQGQRPTKSFARALIQVERRSVGVPDVDGAVGGAKLLLDVLREPGAPAIKRGRVAIPNPTGLGIIYDDCPTHLVFEMRCARVSSRHGQGTLVGVTELNPITFMYEQDG